MPGLNLGLLSLALFSEVHMPSDVVDVGVDCHDVLAELHRVLKVRSS